MRNVPRNARPLDSSYTPNIRLTRPVGSAPIVYFTFSSSFSLLRHARCANFVSEETATIFTPIASISACFSARSASSVGQTNVKSAG